VITCWQATEIFEKIGRLTILANRFLKHVDQKAEFTKHTVAFDA
jgi:hypothetical protein